MVEEVGINTPNVYREDDYYIYRASALGGCLPCLVASRLGHTPQRPPQWLLERFAQGHRGEGPILDAVAAQRNTAIQSVSDNGEQIAVELVNEISKVKIRGHIDGKYYGQVDPTKDLTLTQAFEQVGVEVKFFAKTYWNMWKKRGLTAPGFFHYLIQLSIYMHATGWPFDFAVGKKDENGELVEVDVKRYDNPPVKLDQIWAIVKAVEELAAKNEIPAGPVSPMCTHPQFHTADDMELMPENNLTDEEEERLVELGRMYEVAKVMEKTGKDSKKEIGKAIAELMKKGGLDDVYDSMAMRIKLVDSHSTWYAIDKMRENGYPVDDYKMSTPYSYPKIVDKVGDSVYNQQEGGS